MFDLLIKNAIILDGNKTKKYQANLAIYKGKIKKIGNLKNAKALRIIDASGLYLAPGFVDLNNHSDTFLTLFTIPSLESMLQQGITTILGGNCGSSLAPLVEADMLKSIQKWADISEINLNWLTFKEFLDELEKKEIGLNFASLVGHSTLRRGLLKEEFRALKPNELKIVKGMLEAALEQGAFGLSTGLAYSHAKVASTEEIIELAKTVKKYNGLYASHIRGEAEELLPAVQETIEIGRKTGVSIEISHLKAMGRSFWPNMREAIELIEKASQKGININFDIYPYAITGSVLYILLPDWAAEGGKEVLLKRLKQPATRARIIKEMQEKKYYEYDKITVAISPTDKAFVGKSISEIAQAQNISVEEAVINMLVASEGRIITFLDTLSKDNIEIGLRHNLSFIASDGSGYNLEYYKKKRELVHPRCFGTFPRFLGRYVRDKGMFSWEEAIHKITGGPAQKLGLKKRGLIKKSYWADLVLFSPQEIIDKADFENPYQYPKGIEYVLVNGEVAVENKVYTNKRAGKVLRKS